jgi:hypothetical protein
MDVAVADSSADVLLLEERRSDATQGMREPHLKSRGRNSTGIDHVRLVSGAAQCYEFERFHTQLDDSGGKSKRSYHPPFR